MAKTPLSLADRTVLMTGGSSGIGRAMASALIQAEADVAIVSRRHPREWDGGPPPNWDIDRNWIPAELLDDESTLEGIERWLRSVNGRVDALIHCAATYGGDHRHTLMETTVEEWDELFRVNLRAQFIITKIVLPYMLQQPRGLILAVTSDVAFQPGPGRVGYACSKAASHSLFAGLAAELQDSNVAVVELLPEATVDTPGIRKRRPPSFDFSSCISAESFAAPALSLVRSLGVGLNGQCLKVGGDGSLSPLS